MTAVLQLLNNVIMQCFLNVVILQKRQDLIFIMRIKTLTILIIKRYIDISKAMEIEDDLAFYQWLGIPLDLAGRLQHTIHSDSIEFFDFDYEPFSKEESIILEQAEDKFSNHCQDILNRIESGIDYMFSDEAIIEDIQANNIEFTEEGEI